MLFDLATARLLERKVLLPGPTVLARLVAAVREHAATELWQTPSHATTTAQKQALLGLLTVPAAERTSGLERLRRGPASVTATGMLGALARLAEIQALGVGDVDLTGVPPGRLAALARHATTSTPTSSRPTGMTCSASPGALPPGPSAPVSFSVFCKVVAAPHRSGGPSPSSAGSPRPSTCSPTSTTRTTAAGS